MPTSPDTTLRLIRKIQPATPPTPRVLGVDDWAIRKGRSYGTILVDLEKRQVVDLLPDRTSDVLSNWLREHPGVEVLTRDRRAEYAKGASEGAPNARQVADRWHLLLNVRQMLERYLPGVYGRLKQLPSAPAADSESVVPRRTRAYRRSKAEEIATQESRAKWLARYEEVKRQYQDGRSISAISRDLGMNIATVRKYACAEAFPERSKHPGPSILDPFISYLDARHQEGCENASQLWREIQQKGFSGSKRQVLKWMREELRTPAPTTPETTAATLVTAMKEALDEAVKLGVPAEAAEAFLMGHIRVPLAIVFGYADFPFSDGAKLATERAYDKIFKPDWKERIFDKEALKESVREITRPT